MSNPTLVKIYVKRPMQGYAYCDGKVHKMPEAHAKDFIESERGERPKPKGNPLPKDLPGRDEFFEAGFGMDAISSMDDYEEINGIGPATAEKIEEYFS